MRLCGGGLLLTGTDLEECPKQLKTKQKNRLAAQRSRQKHTDKADALHQQHESLEKHNHALRKEIQALQAELAWWSQTLYLHEHLCHKLDRGPSPALLPAGCQGQATQSPGQLDLHGKHGCQEQSCLFQRPGSSSFPHCHESPGLFPSQLPFLSLGSTVAATSPAQLSPSPILPASTHGCSLQESCLKLSALVPSPPGQLTPPQPLGLEHPNRGSLTSNSHSTPAALGSTSPQSKEHTPALSPSPIDWQTLAVDPSPYPWLSFPLLSSAKIPF
uniref:Basic leucine zipper transcriptional factor ATF-like 2 n=1 Tax=Jaculus jaculus TaxID=51337 RepID=A0A8C5KKL4_JACJA|nr:basic leucine zipper transcriptional factor ATF-like 2 [Jaculus jaculus]